MIYLDNNATTPLDPRVLRVMLPYLKKKFGNPSSRSHKYGWEAEEAVEKAREQVAKLLNVNSYNIIFTSGATESNNIVLNTFKDSFTITSNIEHSSVCEVINKFRYVKHLRVNKNGVIDENSINQVNIPFPPQFVSIMSVNNEIGTIQPMWDIKHIFNTSLIHSDITQEIGKRFRLGYSNHLDFASFSAHKIYGPKGIGALYVKNLDYLSNLSFGGAQEQGLRPGTLNVPAIVGFGKACELILFERERYMDFTMGLRYELINGLENTNNVKILSFPNQISNTLNITVQCESPDIFMSKLSENVAVSYGSACMSLEDKPSRVLTALGLSEEEMKRTIRISIGRFNTKREIKRAVKCIDQAISFANSK